MAIAHLAALFVLLTCITGLPINIDISQKVQGILPGTECNDIEEIISHDPCQPLCSCNDGKVFCAELYCSTDKLPAGQNCRKVPTNGKCCPSYLCMSENGNAELHYPLPQLFLPQELDLTGSYSPKDETKNAEGTLKPKLKTLRI